jgi:hypothetical protein
MGIFIKIIIFILILTIIFFFIGLIIQTVLLRVIETNTINAGFDIKEILNIAFSGKFIIGVLLGNIIISGYILALMLVIIILIITIIGIIIVPFIYIIGIYLCINTFYSIIGQSYNEVKLDKKIK